MVSERGFTLIELLVVVSITAILALIALPAFAQYRERAWDSMAETDLKNSITAQESLYVDNQSYTTCASSLECDTLLPGLVVSQDATGYLVDFMQHTSAGQSFTAQASHKNSATVLSFDSSTGSISQ